MPDRLNVEWTDVNGAWLRTGWYVDSGSDPTPLLAAIAAAQNAAAQLTSQGPADFPAGTPADGQFPSVLDLAVLNFTTTAGTAVQLQIPAPLATDFQASGARIVDPSDANVAAVIAAAIGLLSDNLGNLADTFVGGSYSSRRKEQQ